MIDNEDPIEEVSLPIEPALKFDFDKNDPDFIIDKRVMEPELLLDEDPSDIRERAKGLAKTMDQSGVLLGWTFYLIYYKRLYKNWGYETFNDYVFNEIGDTESTAKRRINLAKKYIKELGIDKEKLAGIGYTRAAMISSVIKTTNADGWLNKAKTSTLKDLRVAIDEEKLKNPKLRVRKITNLPAIPDPLALTDDKTITVDVPTTDPAITNEPTLLKPADIASDANDVPLKKIFYLYEGQLRLLNTALEVMERSTSSAKEGENLSKILQVFLANANTDAKYNSDTPIAEMRSFEENHGGKLVWFKTDGSIKEIREILKKNADIDGEMTS